MQRARVLLVGAGPGDPDLLTVKALRALQSADVVLYDRLVSAEIVALANPQAEFIYTGKDEHQQEAVQKEIHRLFLLHARFGKNVVRLKGGDPFLFGRGAEELQFLRSHDIDVEVIPGITSALGVPALAGIPVTFRNLSTSVTVATGRSCASKQTDWSRFARVETLVLLMAVANRAGIATALIAAGRAASEPAAFIERGTTPDERVIECTLGDVAAGTVQVSAPAVFVIGEVVRLRTALPGCLQPATEIASRG